MSGSSLIHLLARRELLLKAGRRTRYLDQVYRIGRYVSPGEEDVEYLAEKKMCRQLLKVTRFGGSTGPSKPRRVY